MGHYDSAREYDYNKTRENSRKRLLRDVMEGRFNCAFDSATMCGVEYVTLPIFDAALMLEMLKEIAVAEILKKD